MPATVIHSGATGLQEDGERSPRWAFSNGIECKRVFHGTMAECLAGRLFRGQIPLPPGDVIYCEVPGSVPALYVAVWECEIIPLPGGRARLEITFAGGFPGAPLPANEEWIEPKQIDISLAFHPKYAAVVGDMTPLHEKRLAAIETLLGIKSTDVARASDNLKFIFTPGLTDYDALVHELYLKMRRGMTHYWEEYPVLFQRIYSWSPPPAGSLVGRGRIDVPVTIRLNDLPAGLVWKRCADWPHFDGRKWIVERRWIGALDWDDVYSWQP
jgi:hypothetical protein